MLRRTLSCAVSFLVVFLAAGRPAPATDYYVDGKGGNGLAEGGKDSNSGALDAPWLNVQRAVRQLAPGDTLFIRGGVYSISGAITPSSGKSWQLPVTVKSYADETVTFVRPDETKGSSQLYLAGSQYVIVQGKMVLDAISIALGDGDRQGHHLRLKGIELKNCKRPGAVGGGKDFIELIDMNVHHNGGGRLDHGIYSHFSDSLIEGGEWHDNSGFGLYLYNHKVVTGEVAAQDGGLQRITVRNVRMYGNGVGGLVMIPAKDSLVYNNIFYNQSAVLGNGNGQFCNNTFYESNVEHRSHQLWVKSSAWVVRNNLFYSSKGTPAIRTEQGITPTLSNNLTEGDPLFVSVDPASGDFLKLKAGSPAIDAGFDLRTIFTTDRAGTTRPQGAAHDIGAYEYKPVAPAAAPESHK